MEEFIGATDNPLATLLRRIKMRPPQLIARVNERRRRRGSQPLDPKSVYAWIRSRPAHPTLENRLDVLAVLAERAGRRVTADELGWTPTTGARPSRRCIDAPGDASAGDLLREISQGGNIMDRRTLLMLAGTAATAPALALLVADRGPLQAAQNGERLPDRLVTGIENAIRDLRHLDDTDGSTTGLVWAGGLWQNVSRVITNATGAGHGTPAGRRLHRAYIELCEQYGWMLFDADRHPQAQRVYQTGMTLARETDPTPDIQHATANLLASAAYQASWLNQNAEAKTFLDIAERLPDQPPPRLSAVIAQRAVFAAGRRRDTDALRRARDTAHDQLERAGNDDPWWSAWLSHRAVDSATGRAWLAAQAPDAAEPYLTQSLAAVDDAGLYPRDHMLAVLDLADTHRLRGDRTAALDLTRQAAGLSEHVESPRARIRLREITHALN
ncbi:XRE family transcriptional regulator [Streptomyces sp. NPDC059255]|uniref:XRE family transcriptional regulator n=1 Tax=Streptomyces sp. NPDC059255 TaxID=3346793 RepID=UPI0036A5A93A